MSDRVRSITIVLSLPPRALSPNGRAHWRTRAKARRAQRDTAHALALEALNGRRAPRWTRAKAHLCWLAKRKNYIPDRDNAIGCVKAASDGLIDAGVLADDKGLVWGPVSVGVDQQRPRVALTITPEETPHA